MKVIITGWPYRVAAEGARPGVAAEGVGPVVGIGPVVDAVAAEGMPSFRFTRLAGLLIHRIGPSSLHLCGGGMV